MENNYIELLETLQLENNEIGAIQKFIVDHNMEDAAYKQIEAIIRLFRMCDVTDNVIGKFIYKNLSMLIMSHRDLLRVAYVWDMTGTLYSIENRYLLRISQINRTYLRYLYLISGNRYKMPTISYDTLISGEERFVVKQPGEINNIHFQASYENLLDYYIPGDMTLEEKEEKLSSNLSIKSLSWYKNKLFQEKNRINKNNAK